LGIFEERAASRKGTVEATKIDGRRARGLRTREAIVTALMDLIATGDVAPTAQRIADRAGVSVRSVYQHFTDVEGLYADASARTYDRALSMSRDVDPQWDRERRIEEFVASRSAVLEALTPFNRASRLIEPQSDAVRRNRQLLQRQSRDRIALAFAPELSKLDGSARANLLNILDVLASWAAWDHLRSAGLSARAARQLMRSAITTQLATVDGA
jgi:TetR/AcrR family transcriptional regulator of autoinduction and epiphytic fitness